jgi:TRAP-type C4-dicarboxylate transport system permease small subunit
MVIKILRPVAKALTEISSFCLFAVMILVCMDVSMRYFFSNPIPGSLEISEQTVVIITFMCFGYTSLMKRHIRTTAIIDLFPPAVRRVTGYFSRLLMAVLLSFMVWQSAKEAWLSFEMLEVRMGLVPVPIYPTKIAIPIGLFIAWLYYVLGLLGFIDDVEEQEGEAL